MSKIKIFSLGGQNENGKNMYVVDVNSDLFIFDAGLKNADDKMLGIDYIIPNFDYLKENINRIKGIFISHGHQEQFGALADIVAELPDIKIYATEFTLDMIKNDLELSDVKANLNLIKAHKVIKIDSYEIFPIALTHSVPDTVGYVLKTENGAIVYTGNYVFDSTMTGSYKTDIGKLAYIGKQGVLCLLSESLYAEKTGWTAPKHRIASIISETLNRAEGRVIFNVFGADLYRIQELFDEVAKTDRKIIIAGKKIETIIKNAIDKKYINFDKKRISDINQVNDQTAVLLIADEKEKPYSNINRIVRGFDKFVKIKESDTVLFAAPIYEGLEKSASKIFDNIARIGADLIVLSEKDFREYHASSEDLMLMLDLIKPKYFIPIIGDFRAMTAAKEAALKLGLKNEQIILKLNGQISEFIDGEFSDKREKIKVDDILIDGKTVGDVGEVVLKDRELLGENGVVIINFTLEKSTKKILTGPIINSKGFVFGENNLAEIKKMAQTIMDEFRQPFYLDYNRVKNDIRSKIGKYLYKTTDSKPMILVVIQEI